MIAFQARVRFAGAVVRSGSLDASLWLRRRVAHPRLSRTESFGALGCGLHFRLVEPGDLDAALGRNSCARHADWPAVTRRAARERTPDRPGWVGLRSTP